MRHPRSSALPLSRVIFNPSYIQSPSVCPVAILHPQNVPLPSRFGKPVTDSPQKRCLLLLAHILPLLIRYLIMGSSQSKRDNDLPAAPSPDATVYEVEKFFCDYFWAIGISTTLDEAITKARKLPINGTALYLLPSDSFKDAFGAEGRGIYELLVNGDYGNKSRADRSGLVSNYAQGASHLLAPVLASSSTQKNPRIETSSSPTSPWGSSQQSCSSITSPVLNGSSGLGDSLNASRSASHLPLNPNNLGSHGEGSGVRIRQSYCQEGLV